MHCSKTIWSKKKLIRKFEKSKNSVKVKSQHTKKKSIENYKVLMETFITPSL